jgi:hypothetical protein
MSSRAKPLDASVVGAFAAFSLVMGSSLDLCLLTFRVAGVILEAVAEATPKATKISRASVRLPHKTHRAAGATSNDSKRFGQSQKWLARILGLQSVSVAR